MANRAIEKSNGTFDGLSSGLVAAVRGDDGVLGRFDAAIRNDDAAIRNDDAAIRNDDAAIRNDDAAIRNDDAAIREVHSLVIFT